MKYKLDLITSLVFDFNNVIAGSNNVATSWVDIQSKTILLIKLKEIFENLTSTLYICCCNTFAINPFFIFVRKKTRTEFLSLSFVMPQKTLCKGPLKVFGMFFKKLHGKVKIYIGPKHFLLKFPKVT